MKRCPKCSSDDVTVTTNNDLSFIVCKRCGYDESLYEITPAQRSSPKAKAEYSPYKTGGAGRVRK